MQSDRLIAKILIPLSLIFLVYFLVKNILPLIKRPANLSSIQRGQWKTHASKKFKFALDYPPGWDIDDREKVLPEILAEGEIILALYSPGSKRDEYGLSVDENGHTDINGTVIYLKNYKKLSLLNSDSPNKIKNSQFKKKSLERGNQIFTLEAFWGEKGRQFEQDTDKILSSFRLTED